MKRHLEKAVVSHEQLLHFKSQLRGYKGKRGEWDTRPNCTGTLGNFNALGDDFLNAKQSHFMTFGHPTAETNRRAKKRLCDLTMV